MNEQEQMSQLSALFDNELPPAEAELVIRRVLKDPALRVRWERYALIGACVRDEPFRISSPQLDVAERVRLQLTGEADRPQVAEHAIARHRGQRGGWSQFARGALGGSIAAGVAALALVLVRPMGPEAASPVMQMAETEVPVAATGQPQPASAGAGTASVLVAAVDTPPPSITTPVYNPAQRITGPLASFMVAHSAVTASAGRLLPMSAAMSGDYDIAQGTVEMTEAEKRAFR
jgi:sigma-E factor negative regulatory protein RseA